MKPQVTAHSVAKNLYLPMGQVWLKQSKETSEEDSLEVNEVSFIMPFA